MSKSKNILTPRSLIEPYTHGGSWECDYSIEGVLRFLKENEEERGIECDFDPNFQREHVWTSDQQVAWLVQFFRGGQNGRRLFFNMAGWLGDYTGTLELVDGKQRIEAIRAFVADEITIWGHCYSEFCCTPSEGRLFKLLNSIRINVNNLKTRREVLQWYLEMNGGGTPHTDAELQKVHNLLTIT